MDRHALWRRVVHDAEGLQKIAPAGCEPSVEVFVVGREVPIQFGFVETRRDDDPWIRFEALSSRTVGSTEAHPDDYWVHVHENLIERVEIKLRRSAKPSPGFGHTIASADPHAPTRRTRWTCCNGGPARHTRVTRPGHSRHPRHV